MKLFFKFKSSRKVNDVKYCEEELKKFYYKGSLEGGDYDDINISNNKIDYGLSEKYCSCLTVWKKSLLLNCNGFTVINSNGNLVYRIDNYCVKPREIVLMDACGTSILTMRRQKTLKLVDDWLVYNGDASDNYPNTCRKKKPICYVKKNVSLLQANSSVLAYIFVGTSTKNPIYVIEGSFGQRLCKIFHKFTKEIVAEIKMKEAKNNGCVSFGLDVFELLVWPGFDPGFAMTLILILDQMFN